MASEKSSCKLPDPRGPLSGLVPIVSANEKVQSLLESKDGTQSGRKGQRYAKLSPELKAEIGRLTIMKKALCWRTAATDEEAYRANWVIDHSQTMNEIP